MIARPDPYYYYSLAQLRKRDLNRLISTFREFSKRKSDSFAGQNREQVFGIYPSDRIINKTRPDATIYMIERKSKNKNQQTRPQRRPQRMAVWVSALRSSLVAVECVQERDKKAKVSYLSEGCRLGLNRKNIYILATDGDTTAGPCFALLHW